MRNEIYIEENGRGHCPISVSPPAGWSAAAAIE